MPENTDFITIDLTTPEGRRNALGVVDRVLADEDAATAMDWLEQWKALPSTDPARNELANALPKIVLVALPLVSVADLPALLAQFAIPLLDMDASQTEERLTIALESLPIPQRDSLKHQILTALSQSSATLTSVPVARQAGQALPPTLGNWVSELQRRPGTTLEALVAAHPTPTVFTPPERQRLAALLQLVNILRVSSLTPEGIEEQVTVHQGGQVGRFVRGQVATIPVTAGVRPASAFKPAVADLHPDDQAEIKMQVDKLASLDAGPDAGAVADQLVTNLLVAAGLHFPDPLLERRSRTIVQARLKGIRSDAETLDLLTRDPKIGGLGLTSEVANELMAQLVVRAAQLHDQLIQLIAPPPPPPAAPPPPPIPQPSPTPMPVQPPRPVFPARRLTPNTQMVRPRPFTSERTRLDDIKHVDGRTPQTTGPVDELHAITLEEFRTLGVGTPEAIQKLKEKFDALAKESYALRIQGIMAWRSSPLSQLYLNIGQESMETRQPVGQLVTQRRQRNEPTLTEDEFSAIADLNRVLRF